jgi:hypothetical protein
MPKIIRAPNIGSSTVGKERYELYFNGYRQIDKARAQGFYIECIAILESIIADRLEARRACLHPDDASKHNFATLGTLTKELPKSDPQLTSLCQQIFDWSEKRNEAAHQMVKLGAERFTKKWEDRYADLEATVAKGTEIARALSDKVKRLNREDRRRRNATA